jgi:hypothetical protein
MRARRIHRWLGVALACALIGPAVTEASSAHATVADVCTADECNGYPSTGARLEYAAASGEPNALELAFADDVVALHDPGATISAGDLCTSASAHDVACRLDDASASGIPPMVVVQLGDLDDALAIVGTFPFAMTTNAGEGSDVIAGGPKDDILDGGPGDDRLAGGDGGDRLIAGDGRDSLVGGGGDDALVGTEVAESVDSFDGGAGRDEVDFRSTRRALTVMLGDQGSGETDTFIGVEDVTGGAGDDRITGDAGPNKLDGGIGRNEISGAGGDDTIYGGGDSGPGGNLLSCGAGLDTILWVRPADLLARDCERVDLNLSVFGRTTMRAHPVVGRGGRARFAIPCRSRRGCRGSVRLRRATARRGGTLRRFQTRRHGQITVAIRLPRRGALMRVSVAIERRGDHERGRAVYTVENPRQSSSN